MSVAGNSVRLSAPRYSARLSSRDRHSFPSSRTRPAHPHEGWVRDVASGSASSAQWKGLPTSRGPSPCRYARRMLIGAADVAEVAAPPPEPAPPQRELPPWLWRALSALILFGKVVVRVCTGRIHTKNTVEQLSIVGPRSLFVSLLTSSFVGMVFTIQFVREFMRLGLTRSVGGVIALALCRELTPAITAVIFAGRVGSAFAAELGTMQVSEQTDSLRVLRTDPVDYLIVPRVLACVIALPVVTILCFTVGIGASVLLAELLYDVSANQILDSAAQALAPWDIISMELKAAVFGILVAIISCAFGVTTRGGAKGVGLSTTNSVVCSLVSIFIVDFFLSFLFFQGLGDSLKSCMPNGG
ncbi:protein TRIGALACTOSYLDIACYLGLYCEROL 1, chloroplastic [Pycnococcus provasolii]|uniref:Protein TRIGALACTOSYLDIACYLGLYCEROL 1, chloroplastic n=1 Tax=Pycnococcus provasolii TaxID=41880 RepID=A0A830H894_9CHLO|nr:protein TRIGALACTOSYLDIACYLGLYCEROL 1, chloroplastic [Pycnococcus provasolii]